MGANYEISEIPEAWNSRTLPCLKKSGCQIQTHLKNAKSQVRTMNPTSAHELRDLVCGSSASRLRCNLGNQEQRANGQVHFQQANNPRLSLYPTVFLHFYSAMQPPQMAGHVEPVLSLANWIRIWPCPAAGFKCIYYIVGSNLKNQVSTYYGICWTPISWHICWLDPRLRHGLVLAQRPSGERCRS